MLPLTLELYDGNNLQYRPAFRKLRFAKTFFGGEDLWATFVLDRSPHLDYPDVAYGNDVILRSGLISVFAGEMRQIDQDMETITVKVLGVWVYLDDYGYDGQGKLWSDTRYQRWKPMTEDISARYYPSRYEIDTNNRLWMAPRRDERFSLNYSYGGLYYYCPYDQIKRVTFNYDFVDPGLWELHLYSNAGTPAAFGAEVSEWSLAATAAGAVVVTLPTPRSFIYFRLFYNAAWARYAGETGMSCYGKITDLAVYGSTDTTPTSSDVAIDVVAQLQAGTPISDDVGLIDAITLTLEPLFYERGESCHEAVEDAASFGDSNNELIGWGVEPGGNRVYLRVPDRDRVRYVVPPEHASRLQARGQVDKDFLTDGWGKYTDEDGQVQFTDHYYAHVTPAGIVANTTATGDDLASVVYGVQRQKVVNFGRVSAALATDFIQHYLIDHGHPQVKSSFKIQGPVQDMDKGGAWIEPYEMEMGHVVQIPHFRAVEAEGAVGVDLREWDTTFLLVAMQYNMEKGEAILIPEGASEDLERLVRFAGEFGLEKAEERVEKRDTILAGGVR